MNVTVNFLICNLADSAVKVVYLLRFGSSSVKDCTRFSYLYYRYLIPEITNSITNFLLELASMNVFY